MEQIGDDERLDGEVALGQAQTKAGGRIKMTWMLLPVSFNIQTYDGWRRIVTVFAPAGVTYDERTYDGW